MVKLHSVKKQVLVEYENCQGHTVACAFGQPGGDLIEKKDVRNHLNAAGRGVATFSVGADFTGPVECDFKGSEGGEDSGEVNVP